MSGCCKDIVIDEGPIGLTGDTGDTGIVGDKGLVGDKGPAGANAPILKGVNRQIFVTLTALVINSMAGTYDLLSGQPIVTYSGAPYFYDDWSTPASFNMATGIFTVPETYEYDMSFEIGLKSASNWDTGYIIAGIVNITTNTVYVARRVDCFTNMTVLTLSGTLQGIPLVSGDEFQIYILNNTNNNYPGVAGDVVRFMARKCK